jgi:thiol:disulfide interchange protein DsbA
MIRKLTALFIWFLFIGAVAMASAAEFRLGKEYEELSFPQAVETGKKIEVREFFWYGCPHCYALEPVLNHWLKTKPANAAFILSPSIANPAWEFHARLYFTLEALGKAKKLRQSVFSAIHEEKQKLNSIDDVISFVSQHGIKRQDFLKAYNSFGVRLKLKRAAGQGANYDIHSVPMIIVDGKYRTSVHKAGGEERLMKVIEFLIKKSAKERRQSKQR